MQQRMLHHGLQSKLKELKHQIFEFFDLFDVVLISGSSI